MSITDLIPWRRKEQSVPSRQAEEESIFALQRDMNRLFDDFFRSFGMMPWRGFEEPALAFSPQLDIVEDEDNIQVSAELPGMDRNDIDVSISNGTLTIRGEKQQEREDRGTNYFRRERTYGSFRRSVPLATEVDHDQAEATFKRGVLTVTLPKSAEAKKKRITIKAG